VSRLVWESAGTDEPGDQAADSRIVDPGCTSMYYLLGPEGARRWGVELIGVNHAEEVPGSVTDLGNQHPTEADAKNVAHAYEVLRDKLARRVTAYAAKFAAETVLAEPPRYVEPTDVNLAATFAGCGRPTPVALYEAVRAEFAAQYADAIRRLHPGGAR
jgi:hypothetical protein